MDCPKCGWELEDEEICSEFKINDNKCEVILLSITCSKCWWDCVTEISLNSLH